MSTLDGPVKLYHLAPSHHCEKARKVLEFKGIDHEVVRVPYQDHGELIRATDQDYTPAVQLPDGEVIVWHRIADWAEDVRAEPTLYPAADAEDRERVRGLCQVLDHWAHTIVEDVTWKVAVPNAPARFDDADERWRFVEFQERKWGALEVMAHRRPEFVASLEDICERLERTLGDQDFLLGDAPSLADLSVYGGLHPLYFVGEGVPKRFGQLAAWHDRVDAL